MADEIVVFASRLGRGGKIKKKKQLKKDEPKTGSASAAQTSENAK